MRVAAFNGGPNVPSARLRIYQQLAPLAARGIDVEPLSARSSSFPPVGTSSARARWIASELVRRTGQIARTRRAHYDLTLIHREFVSTLATLERCTSRPRVFDVDDALWVRQNRFSPTDRIVGGCDLVIAGNRYLADHYGAFARTTIIPTAVDVRLFRPRADSLEGPPVIGWSGLSSGFPYLTLVERALRYVLDARPDAVFAVMSDRPPILNLPPHRTLFIPWTPSGEMAFLSSLTAGIMPLVDGIWERGKCSYKMLAYMASAVPVVVSPVGMNVDVLAEANVGFGAATIEDWVEALLVLITDADVGRHLGAAGRALVELRYDVEPIADQLAAALRSVRP